MKTVTVKRVINAPCERIFEVISNHEGYASLLGMTVARLERAGRIEKNGEGALRYLKSGAVWFREEITIFERPHRMDYLIIDSLLPLEHKGASIRLRETANGTEVSWTSSFNVKVPLIGGLLSRVLAKQMAQGFGGALKAIDRHVTSS